MKAHVFSMQFHMVIIFGASIYMTSCRAWIVTDEVQVVGDSELACLLQSMSGSDLDYAVESVHLKSIIVCIVTVTK